MRLGVALAMSAVAVNGPLLILALLGADGVVVPTGWRVMLLGVRALGTVIVLSLGAAYIAHAAVIHRNARRALIAVWLIVLGGTAAIVTPMVVGAVGAALAPVVPSLVGRWVWALVSVVTVEVAAAGCMLAAAVGSAASQQAAARLEPEAVLGQVGAAGWQPASVQLGQPAEELARVPSEEVHCKLCGRGFSRRLPLEAMFVTARRRSARRRR